MVLLLNLGLLEAPTRNIPEKVCDAIRTFAGKNGKPPVWKPPGLPSLQNFVPQRYSFFFWGGGESALLDIKSLGICSLCFGARSLQTSSFFTYDWHLEVLHGIRTIAQQFATSSVILFVKDYACLKWIRKYVGEIQKEMAGRGQETEQVTTIYDIINMVTCNCDRERGHRAVVIVL